MVRSDFDDIRPYYESEINEAMHRIADNQWFSLLASYVFPDKELDEVKQMLKGISTVGEFQREVMYAFTQQVIRSSVSEFTYSGLEHVEKDKQYLFVSNHRDIVLDASLLQNILHKNGYYTTEITFGSNLMVNQLVVDIGKCNKMFKVVRGGSMKDFYRNSIHLSEYIRYALTEKRQSVWIAQRNGRTKDGNDLTDQGIIKMFGMSGAHDKVQSLAQLNILPMAISYEWEPCDVLKMMELYESRGVKYIKKPGEDLNSIMTGIVQPKGHVHIELCQPLTVDDLMAFDDCTSNEFHKNVATLIDDRIHRGYKLMPNNYIAYDLLYGRERYKNFYTDGQKAEFIEHAKQLCQYSEWELDVLQDIFLKMYANPVINSLK